MKFKLEHKYVGGPFEDVLRFVTEEYIFEATDLPNVQSMKVLEETLTEDKKIIRNEWCAHGQIPKAAQHILKPQMLTWTEHTVLDRKTRVFTTKITPFYFKNVFSCESKMYFVKKSDREFLRITEGFLNIKIPIIGLIIEEAIILHLKSNMQHEYKHSYKMIKEKFGA